MHSFCVVSYVLFDVCLFRLNSLFILILSQFKYQVCNMDGFANRQSVYFVFGRYSSGDIVNELGPCNHEEGS